VPASSPAAALPCRARLASGRLVRNFRAVPRNWTTEQAVSLAPDAAALKTAQALASPRKWTALGRDADFIWGLAQGRHDLHLWAEQHGLKLERSEQPGTPAGRRRVVRGR
jgi:hypothetical protein